MYIFRALAVTGIRDGTIDGLYNTSSEITLKIGLSRVRKYANIFKAYKLGVKTLDSVIRGNA
jgi:hypothetical protein